MASWYTFLNVVNAWILRILKTGPGEYHANKYSDTIIVSILKRKYFGHIRMENLSEKIYSVSYLKWWFARGLSEELIGHFVNKTQMAAAYGSPLCLYPGFWIVQCAFTCKSWSQDSCRTLTCGSSDGGMCRRRHWPEDRLFAPVTESVNGWPSPSVAELARKREEKKNLKSAWKYGAERKCNVKAEKNTEEIKIGNIEMLTKPTRLYECDTVGLRANGGR